jgi:hypothetical protein
VLQWTTGKRSADRVWENRGAPEYFTDIPRPDEDYVLHAACEPGRWRLLVSVSGLNHAGHPKNNQVPGTVANRGQFRIQDCAEDRPQN